MTRAKAQINAQKTGRESKWCAALLIVVLLSLLISQSGSAAELYDFFDGVRSLGMGGSYTAIVNDETSLLTNPAGLGKIRQSIITIANPELQGAVHDTDVTTLINANAQEPNDLLGLTQKEPGTHWNAKAQIFPSIVGPGLGIGVLGKYQYDAQFNAATNDFRLDYTNDYAAVLGGSLGFFGGVLKVGTSVRYIDRTEVHRDFITTTTPSIDMSQVASEGTGIAVDTGMILTVPVELLPSLAIVARDLGTTAYGLSKGMFMVTNQRPVSTPQTLDAGISVSPIMSNRNRASITLDYHDVLDAYGDTDILKHAHAGVEFNFSDFFFLRAGCNQGYWTAGFEVATEYFQFQAASYGEEIGTQTSPQEDRRWVGEFAFRF